ncbi:AbrB/MazE/SpoVT family DNA-binding domain-containing protein [Halobacterium yunchengense]|uniref:AbrB/MazE/SpoVT family DNA-binding domain-containing protein n=1 Tax=Halobacterium yunchengense TaxID=3108497 RepID=UPI00300B4898
METRKVQQVGGGTYTVSLPQSWAESCGVEAGAPVYLYAHDDGSLVVRRREREDSDLASASVAVEGDSPAAARRRLRAAYAAGYKRVTLTADGEFSTEQRRAVSAAARSLVGVEVTESGADRVVVQGLLDPADVSVRQSVLQLRFVATAMLEAAVEAVAAGGAADGVAGRADEADRVFALVTRHFDRSLSDLEEVDQLGVGRRQLFRYYATAQSLVRVADRAVDVADAADRLDGGLPDGLAGDVAAVGADARAAVEDATDAAVTDADHAAADDATDACERVADRCRALDGALADHDAAVAVPAARAVDAIEGVTEHVREIAAVALRGDVAD